MKAVLVHTDTKQLYLGFAEDPIAKQHEIVVSIKATALNRADLLQKQGKYPPPLGESDILGLEMSGIVESVGESVVKWRQGDRVCALLSGGGYAEKVVIHEDMAIAIPDSFSFEEAAAIPEAFLTAYLNVKVLGKLDAGEHVLIHAAGSGVGTAAIQIAKELGAICIATVGSEKKMEACRKLGAHHQINYREADFSEKVLQITSNKGADLILDPIAASYWDKNAKSISMDGRWVLIGGLGGYELEKLNLRIFLSKRIQFIGSTLRSLSIERKIALTNMFHVFSQERFKQGQLVPVIDKVFDWQDANEAHEYMEQNMNLGKIILRVNN